LQCHADAARVANHVTRSLDLFTPRRIAIAAAFLATACALAIVPVLALGDDTAARTTPDVPRAILEARENVADVNATALEDAPPAVGSGCGRTLEVEGIGDTCVTTDGLLRIEAKDGGSATIHGLDAPPLTAADGFAPVSQAEVDSAGPSDVTCAAPGERGYVLVYARPLDVTSRLNEIAPLLRQEVYKMSAFLDAESQSIDPRHGKRLPLRCEGGTPTVLPATIPAVGSGGLVFETVVDNLRELGYSYNSTSATDRYIVYLDAPSAAGAAGTGHIFDDPRASTLNSNNKGGTYAVEYRWAQGGGVPHWDVLLHEVMHTMGGIPNAAPNASGNGHCNDGLDVMCYADGGRTSSYTAGSCSSKLLDCGRNDYFNPAPPTGSYLAGNWNVAHSNNLWLQHRQTGDGIAPTAPAGITQSGASNTAAGITWAAASDNVAVTAYTVRIRATGGGWRDVVTTSRRATSIGGLAGSTSYEVSVTALDAAGNASTPAVAPVATNAAADRRAPARPTGLKVAKSDLKSATFRWRDTSDNVGVLSYELRLVTKTVRGRAPRSLGDTGDIVKTISLRGLKAGSRQRVELIARDAAGNVSRGVARTFVVPKDRARPTAPTAGRTLAVASTSAQLAWTPSRDNAGGAGVKHYLVYYRSGSKWKQFGRRALSARSTQVRLSGLRPRTTYAFRIHARDAANNMSAASRVISVRTR
jgi:chitodextrinase